MAHQQGRVTTDTGAVQQVSDLTAELVATSARLAGVAARGGQRRPASLEAARAALATAGEAQAELRRVRARLRATQASDVELQAVDAALDTASSLRSELRALVQALLRGQG